MEDKHQLIKRSSDVRGNGNEKLARVAELIDFGYDDDSDAGDSLRIRDYFRAVVKRLWLVCSVTLLVTAAAVVYMAQQPDVYSAKVRVQVNLESNPALGSVIINTPASDPAYFNTQLMVLGSPAVLKRAVKTLDLPHNEAFLRPRPVRNHSTWQNLLRMIGRGEKETSPKPGGVLTKSPLIASDSPANPQDERAEAETLAPYVAAIHRGLDVNPVESTRLISIGYSHADPAIAALVVNAVADAYVITNLQNKTEANAKAGDFIQKRIAELQEQIRRGEEAVISYSKGTQILSLEPGQDLIVARLGELNRQLMIAENERKIAETARSVATAPGALDALVDGTSPRVLAAESQIAALRLKRSQLLVESGEEWPEVKELDKQISELEKEITQSRQNAKSLLLAKLDTTLKQATAREQTIRSDYEKQWSQTLSRNEAAINYRMMQQEIATNKTLLDGLLQRSKENDVILAGTPNNIQIIDYATVPKEPVAPRRWQVVGIAFLFSLAFGVGVSIFLEHFHAFKPIRTTNEVGRMLHLPTLATVPSLKKLPSRARFPAIRALRKTNGNGNGTALMLDTKAKSPLAEAYRMLRTSVLLTTEDTVKSFLVTSSVPGEGKTTTAINMSVVLAQTGASVLLIDGDLRNPHLHTVFNMDNERGLSNILSNEVAQTDWTSLIQRDPLIGAFVLPSGPIPQNPSELLTSKNLSKLIAHLEGEYDYVILDSPPVSYFTDSVLMSTVVNAVVLVVHSSSSPREVVIECQRVLNGVGARIIGVILNHAERSHSTYRYYKQYYQNALT